MIEKLTLDVYLKRLMEQFESMDRQLGAVKGSHIIPSGRIEQMEQDMRDQLHIICEAEKNGENPDWCWDFPRLWYLHDRGAYLCKCGHVTEFDTVTGEGLRFCDEINGYVSHCVVCGANNEAQEKRWASIEHQKVVTTYTTAQSLQEMVSILGALVEKARLEGDLIVAEQKPRINEDFDFRVYQSGIHPVFPDAWHYYPTTIPILEEDLVEDYEAPENKRFPTWLKLVVGLILFGGIIAFLIAMGVDLSYLATD